MSETYLTNKVKLKCCHGISVEIEPKESNWTLDGADVLTQSALEGASLKNGTCGQPDDPKAGIKHCEKVTTILDGLSQSCSVNGDALITDKAVGFTNGQPMGVWTVEDPGQSIMHVGGESQVQDEPDMALVEKHLVVQCRLNKSQVLSNCDFRLYLPGTDEPICDKTDAEGCVRQQVKITPSPTNVAFLEVDTPEGATAVYRFAMAIDAPSKSQVLGNLGFPVPPADDLDTFLAHNLPDSDQEWLGNQELSALRSSPAKDSEMT